MGARLSALEGGGALKCEGGSLKCGGCRSNAKKGSRLVDAFIAPDASQPHGGVAIVRRRQLLAASTTPRIALEMAVSSSNGTGLERVELAGTSREVRNQCSARWFPRCMSVEADDHMLLLDWAPAWQTPRGQNPQPDRSLWQHVPAHVEARLEGRTRGS
jgi:hypothetical protein